MVALNSFGELLVSFDSSSEPHLVFPNQNYCMIDKAAFHFSDNYSCCWEILQDYPVCHQMPWTCCTWASLPNASTGFSELWVFFTIKSLWDHTHCLVGEDDFVYCLVLQESSTTGQDVKNTQKATTLISPECTRTAQPWLSSGDALWHRTGNGKYSISGIMISCINWLSCLLWNDSFMSL